MKLLDRYVIVSFLRIFVVSFLVLTVTTVTFDYIGRMGRFGSRDVLESAITQGQATWRLVLRFYAAYLPSLLKELIPFVSLVAALLTTASMLRSNEVMPVVASGVSARRLFLPVVGCAFLVSVGHLLFQEYVVPSMTREQITLRHLLQGDRKRQLTDLPHLRDGKGTVTCAESFTFSDGSLRGVVIQRPWHDGGFERWEAPLLVPEYPTESGSPWIAPQGVTIFPDAAEAVPTTLPPGSRVRMGVSWDDIIAIAGREGTRELSLTQLSRLAHKFPLRRNLRVSLHKHISRPLTGFVLVLLGIPVLLRAGRSVIVGLAVAFVLSAGTYVLDLTYTSLGDRGDLPPMVAAYLPVILLFSLGTAAYTTVPT